MIDLLKISYERIVGTQEIELNDSNYQEYGYAKDDSGYYKYDSEQEENVYFTTHEIDITETYTHILPNPSKFDDTYADVDKEGSGRNESNGQMQRERIGHYCSIDVQWNIIPNSNERINLIRILRKLPPKFRLEYHDSDSVSNVTTTKEFYRADISESLYLFVEDSQLWQGISTTFIQFDVEEYNDQEEPVLLEV